MADHFQDTNGDGTRDDNDIHYLHVATPDNSLSGNWVTGASEDTPAGPTMMRVGAYALELINEQQQFQTASEEFTSAHPIRFDSTISKLLLPAEVFSAFYTTFNRRYATLDAMVDAHNFTETTHGCAGPVREDYDPDDEMPTLIFHLTNTEGVPFWIGLDAEHWAVKTSDVDGLPTPPAGTTYVCMAVSVATTDEFVFGTVFMQDYYTVFDRQHAD